MLAVDRFGRLPFIISLTYGSDSPIEIVIGTIFLYQLLGVSAFVGLAMTCLFLPLNHLAGKIVVGAQDNLMKARDERVSLMNEVCALSLAHPVKLACAHCHDRVDSGSHPDVEGT